MDRLQPIARLLDRLADVSFAQEPLEEAFLLQQVGMDHLEGHGGPGFQPRGRTRGFFCPASGFRFPGINVPQGATITGATLEAYINGVNDDLFTTIYGDAIADATAPHTSEGEVVTDVSVPAAAVAGMRI